MKAAKLLLMRATSAFGAAACLIVATAGSAANAGSFTHLLKKAQWQATDMDLQCGFDTRNQDCASAAAQTMCNYSGLMAMSETSGRIPTRRQIQDLTYLAETIGNHMDEMEEMVAKGMIRNIRHMSKPEQRDYCREVGAVAWP